MRSSWTFLIPLLFFADAVRADQVNYDAESQRLSGFAEHKKENQVFDREREKGKTSWLEELEQWERERQDSLADYKKMKKSQSPQESGPEYKEDQQFKRTIQKDYDESTLEYLKEKARNEKNRKKQISISEEDELDVYLNRPRYDFKKRQMLAGKGQASTLRGGGSHGFSGSGGFGGGESFPAPPSFEGFGNEGYVPPPVMPDAEEYTPPPPPPMPSFEGGEFPPPPPPPPAWDGEGGY